MVVILLHAIPHTPPNVNAQPGYLGCLALPCLHIRSLILSSLIRSHIIPTRQEFHCDMASGRNFARLPTGKDVAADGSFARSVAVAVADFDVEDASESRLVARALREAATHEGPLMHLLSSCYCTQASLGPALLEACRHGNLENVHLLLHAGAQAAVQPPGENKCALHVACESGHEEVARALVSSDPSCVHCQSSALSDRTPLDVARDNDMGGLARRLEQHANECAGRRAQTAGRTNGAA